LRTILHERFPRLGRFFIRLGSWEYWPFEVVYAPLFVYWLWLAAKARHFMYFSAANPGILSGGMLGESKIDILDALAPEYVPITAVLPPYAAATQVAKALSTSGLGFPLIAKPDVGERGWRVEKIYALADLETYAAASSVPFLLQEFIEFPLELGVFYYRLPSQSKGRVSSIVQKEFLTVIGDGVQNLRSLIRASDRALLQWEVLKVRFASDLDKVLALGEVFVLEGIGNHSRGTKFLDAGHLITPEVEALFDRICLPLQGFYYGRFDLRCTSEQDFLAGVNIRILELNGVGAEPAHIYQPGFSLLKAWQILLHHWRIAYLIARENHKKGVAYMTVAEARAILGKINKNKSVYA
jgi:hypothetical protein